MTTIAQAFPLTPDQRAKERALTLAIAMDATILIAMTLSGVLGGSLTMLAEALRGWLACATECFTILLLRRIHRFVLADMDYGAGKLEQVASVVIGVGMLVAAGWVGLNVLRIVNGQREVGTPLGLVCAAIVGIVNLYVNVLAWDAVRRTMAEERSIIMEAQLRLRTVKLLSSLVVSVGLTVAALSTDDVIVAWADAAGSLFVAAYMVVTAVSVLRDAAPDLLDRSADAGVRQVVERTLGEHAGEYARVDRWRSRRSGHTTFIEIDLAFDPSLTMADVQGRVDVLTAAMHREVADAEISVVASATRALAAAG